MSEKVSTISTNGDTKKERTNGRLQSIFNPATSRDLSLLKTNVRAQPTKRVYTPNLNTVRHKPTDKSSDPDTNQKDRGRNQRTRGGKNNNLNRKNANLQQTQGFLSEGLSAAPANRRSDNSSFARDSGGVQSIERPRLTKRDTKPSKNELEYEQKTLSELLGDEDGDDLDSDDSDSKNSSEELRPVKITQANKSSFNESKKLDVGLVKVKVEPVDDEMVSSSDSPESSLNGITIKTEPGLPMKSEEFERMDKLFDASPTEYFLFQMPDSLPGREPENMEIKTEFPEPSTSKETSTQSTSKSSHNLCTLQHLQEGHIGRLVRHASGRTKLYIGDIAYDVSEGLSSEFTQHAATIYANRSERSANIFNLGEIKTKFNVSPDWMELLRRRTS